MEQAPRVLPLPPLPHEAAHQPPEGRRLPGDGGQLPGGHCRPVPGAPAQPRRDLLRQDQTAQGAVSHPAPAPGGETF